MTILAWEINLDKIIFIQSQNLADSIRKVGLLQPIVIRVNDEGHFEVVLGCRRYTACKTLGWKKIACVIIEANDKEAFETSLIENIQRSLLIH